MAPSLTDFIFGICLGRGFLLNRKLQFLLNKNVPEVHTFYME